MNFVKMRRESVTLLIFSIFLIYILTGPPREGKTFYATFRALEILRKGKEKVFSNYPIIFRVSLSLKQRFLNFLYKTANRISGSMFPVYNEKILSSIPWRPDLMKECLHDCSIFIDEAYKDHYSREWQNFEKEQLEWFATNGHNLLDVWIIAQNSAFVDTNIRRLANYFIKMRKKYLFFNVGFLWFEANFFLTESEMNLNNRKVDYSYSKDRLTMRNDVRCAYDTHYFRDHREEQVYLSWYDVLKVVPKSKFHVNYGKIIMTFLIFSALLFFFYVFSIIFL